MFEGAKSNGGGGGDGARKSWRSAAPPMVKISNDDEGSDKNEGEKQSFRKTVPPNMYSQQQISSAGAPTTNGNKSTYSGISKLKTAVSGMTAAMETERSHRGLCQSRGADSLYPPFRETRPPSPYETYHSTSGPTRVIPPRTITPLSTSRLTYSPSSPPLGELIYIPSRTPSPQHRVADQSPCPSPWPNEERSEELGKPSSYLFATSPTPDIFEIPPTPEKTPSPTIYRKTRPPGRRSPAKYRLLADRSPLQDMTYQGNHVNQGNHGNQHNHGNHGNHVNQGNNQGNHGNQHHQDNQGNHGNHQTGVKRSEEEEEWMPRQVPTPCADEQWTEFDSDGEGFRTAMTTPEEGAWETRPPSPYETYHSTSGPTRVIPPRTITPLSTSRLTYSPSSPPLGELIYIPSRTPSPQHRLADQSPCPSPWPNEERSQELGKPSSYLFATTPTPDIFEIPPTPEKTPSPTIYRKTRPPGRRSPAKYRMLADRSPLQDMAYHGNHGNQHNHVNHGNHVNQGNQHNHGNHLNDVKRSEEEEEWMPRQVPTPCADEQWTEFDSDGEGFRTAMTTPEEGAWWSPGSL
eukprot:sb/3463411/